MMSHKFVKDPRELVKAGDVVKVKVLEVDLQRRRVALTMKLDAPPQRDNEPRRELAGRNAGVVGNRSTSSGTERKPAAGRETDRGARGDRNRDRASTKDAIPRTGSARGIREAQPNGAMAEAWARALKR
jgi:uncharacterized protein